jgi:DNA-binding transcriptional LysR family regulator
VRFKGLDLNLLHALLVLLEERSVSRAAERLHLSQPAASAALSRLREFFKDELLILHGKRMIPTSYAETLVPEVRRALEQVDSIISMSSEFDALRSERLFRIIASDYVASVLVTPAIQALEEAAPSIQIDIRQPNDQIIKQFERGQMDLLLTPEEFVAPNHPTELLFEERQVVVGWSDNPLVQRGLSAAAFAESPQVAVALGPSMSPDYAGRYLDGLIENRRIEIFAPSFSVVPWLVIGTQRLAVMHERFAQLVAQYLPLRIQPLPIDIPPMREMLQYHSARTHDSGIVWLRRVLHEMAARMI